ncbi:hypothetical protein N7466_002895 [Penicillium verhagenii]|uniref:uncharacterized protein n=1 Tax=Penicillium verhagenii TaxID=1562060 RepID=UPI0025450EB3|nr:uncharacterized protein N7466_002895 [Penicillium verhagenii]KAJ5939761.1 hypothetical protein N7466_002895 [Penicillium verhagenii]
MKLAPSTEDPAAKRRLQNRLNQRASRERRALKSGKLNKNHQRWIIYTEEANPRAELGMAQNDDQVSASTSISRATSPPEQCITKPSCSRNPNIIADWNARKQHLIAQLDYRVASAAAAAHPLNQLTLLAPVTNLNVINAMLTNASLMGLTLDLLGEDLVSAFNIVGPMTMNLPPSLQPTSSQKDIIHHPWIDLMPMRSFRDVLLNNMDQYDEDDFCGDLHGQVGASNGIGLIVWGEAWDPNAYEISEAVFRKWSWLVEKCPELIRTSNYWRRKRGEKPLRVERPVGFVLAEEIRE